VSRVAIIGAGLSGLVAAHRLRATLGPAVTIEVFESADRVGGLLHSLPVAGRDTDVGAEAFVLRRPEARALVAELGLDDELVVPSGARPAVWADERLNALPAPAWMGIPAGAEAMADLADADDLRRMAAESTRPLAWTPGEDCSLGAFVADRFGPSVVARSLDPMIGGVYSCRSGDTGLRAVVPALARLLDDGAPSLTAAVAALLPAPDAPRTPVFGALRGGYRRLVDALLDSASATVRLEHPVAWVARTSSGWSVDDDDFDAVVVATPAPVAARQLRTAAPVASEGLAGIATAPSAVVAMAVPHDTPLPQLSGVLAATGEELGRGTGPNPVKAVTLSSRKWEHFGGPGADLRLRASFGRLGEPVTGTDAELVATATAAVSQVCGGADVVVVDAAVQRWPGGLPCYAPGHDAVIAAVEAALPAGVAVAGSAYAGVGVPACIGRAGAAAAAVRAHLAAL